MTGNEVNFTAADMNFVKKFGLFEATEMVLDYKITHKTPFIYDTHQLADFLAIRHKELFKIIKECNKMYSPVSLKKKNGKTRKISAPDSYLKYCQNLILHRILNHIPISEYAKAYRSGSTIYSNAVVHCNKKYILKIDITDFFGSITFEQVLSTAFNSNYFPKNIGFILTTLCCKDEVLPQGAPTSPALSNIVMKHFDDVMGEWCKKNQISYTRYCDDITFSSDKPLFLAYAKAESMLCNMGFELNKSKTRFVTNANRQSVTGLTVNEKVSVSKDYKRKLRQEVYYALRFGLENSIIRSNKEEFIEGDYINAYKYYNTLVGKLNFVLQIEPENTYFADVLERLEHCPEVLNWCGYDY